MHHDHKEAEHVAPPLLQAPLPAAVLTMVYFLSLGSSSDVAIAALSTGESARNPLLSQEIVDTSTATKPESTSVMNFFDPRDFETQTCRAGNGMWQSGTWSFALIPWPAYRELHGWDLGARAAMGIGVERPHGAAAVLTASIGYNLRDDRMFVFPELIPYLYKDDRLNASLPIRGFVLPERHGAAVGPAIKWSEDEADRSAEMRVSLVVEKFLTRKSLGPEYWSPGEHVWIGVSAKGHGLGGRLSRDFWMDFDFRVGTEAFGGQFVYRRAFAKLSWAQKNLTVWGAKGTASGYLPEQGLFDFGNDGQIKGMPLLTARTKTLAAAGLDAGIRVGGGMFLGPYATVADIEPNVALESGFLLAIGYLGKESQLRDWFLRVDVPVYFSEAERLTSRNNWDPRRVMIHLDFPIENVERTDHVTYRYPNR